nr:putative reverse transcriptase, RNA-dependent DNA polymerase [Tanacetum cinerariifolium]
MSMIESNKEENQRYEASFAAHEASFVALETHVDRLLKQLSRDETYEPQGITMLDFNDEYEDEGEEQNEVFSLHLTNTMEYSTFGSCKDKEDVDDHNNSFEDLILQIKEHDKESVPFKVREEVMEANTTHYLPTLEEPILSPIDDIRSKDDEEFLALSLYKDQFSNLLDEAKQVHRKVRVGVCNLSQFICHGKKDFGEVLNYDKLIKVGSKSLEPNSNSVYEHTPTPIPPPQPPLHVNENKSFIIATQTKPPQECTNYVLIDSQKRQPQECTTNILIDTQTKPLQEHTTNVFIDVEQVSYDCNLSVEEDNEELHNDELRRRVEEFIDKIHNGWKAEKLMALFEYLSRHWLYILKAAILTIYQDIVCTLLRWLCLSGDYEAQKGYRSYNPTTCHMFTTMNCVFLKTKYYYATQHSSEGENERLDTLNWLRYVACGDERGHSTADESHLSTQPEDHVNVIQTAPNLIPEVSNSAVISNPIETNASWQGGIAKEILYTRRKSKRYALPLRANREVPQKRYFPEKVSRGSRYPMANIAKGNLSNDAKAFVASVYSDEIPANTEQAFNLRKWKKAMEEEMEALTKNNTREKCVLKLGKKIVRCRWVFTNKYKPDGTIERYKARLVAKGYILTYGIDYCETFSPVAKINTIRVLCSIAANKGWPFDQFDVKNAFLHRELKEEVYIEAPHGYTKCLDKGKYGGNLITCLIIYVDDMIVTGYDKEEITKLKKYLFTEFKMKDLGRLKYFLGIEVLRSKQGIFMCQKRSSESVYASTLEEPYESSHEILKISQGNNRAWSLVQTKWASSNSIKEIASRKERVPETFDYRSQYDAYECDTYHANYNIEMEDDTMYRAHEASFVALETHVNRLLKQLNRDETYEPQGITKLDFNDEDEDEESIPFKVGEEVMEANTTPYLPTLKEPILSPIDNIRSKDDEEFLAL